MKNIWVEPGCIVCRACEVICPEVFLVTDETATVREDADMRDVETIREAAGSCPVEVIRLKE